MPLTDAEFDFLNAYVHEIYTPAMTGPHTRALRELGVTQWDLSWLLTAWERQALAEGKSPLGSPHLEPLSVPWTSRDEILTREHSLRKELEHSDEPSRTIPR
jgi:hypothetical protein